MLPPALQDYMQTLYQMWVQTGETSDKALAAKLGIEADSVRQRRVRLYSIVLPDGSPRTIPNLLRYYLKDAQII
jgi:hypothetical protein